MAKSLDDWLAALDLAYLAELFTEHEIEFRDLWLLSDDDLKGLGVALGPRRRILNAIARSGVPDELNQTKELDATELSSRTAERRQLTVMFCDLVGSTELSEKLDPEDLSEVMRRYQDAVVGAVARYGGHVAKFLGDGVLTYFGWPVAFEDQAERAVRASLDVSLAVSSLAYAESETLIARIGIATGIVVVGDLVGASSSEAEAVVGQTPNLAARLQGIALPGQVIISPGTRALIGNNFELEDLGRRYLKGFTDPVSAYCVIGEQTVESRFHAQHTSGLNPIVDRECEQEQLRRNWNSAKAGTGRVVMLSGEAGIGKSRLVEALREHIGEQDHFRLRYQCSARHTSSAFFPIIERLERTARFEADDTPTQKLDKLEAVLRLAEENISRSAPLFASLLSLPTDTRYGPLELSSAQLREQTIEAMVGQLVALSTIKPVLFVLEDAHWIDPTTGTLLNEIIRCIAGHQVLVVMTYRPGYQSPAGELAHVTHIEIERLDESLSGEVVLSVGGGELPDQVIARIRERAEGVPLFLEELTKSVLETGLSADTTAAVDAIPTSLQASLIARLDHLNLAKELAQTGAVIGRTFSHDLIAAVSGSSEDVLHDALSRIVELGLMSRRGDPPDATYTFKHALIQDAAYETLLRSKRREIHTKIAKTLRERFPTDVEEAPEVLAHHLSIAQIPEEAFEQWVIAGRRAGERSAHIEAIAMLQAGLKELEGISDTAASGEMELGLRIILGVSLLAINGWSADVVQENYERAVILSENTGDDDKKINALRGLGNVFFLRGQVNKAREMIDRELKLISGHKDPGLEMGGYRAVGMCSFFTGKFDVARENLAKANAIYDPAKHAAQKFSLGTDPAVISLSMIAWTDWFLGKPENAEANISAALKHAEELQHPFSLAYAQCIAASVFQCLRNAPATLEYAQAANATAQDNNYPYWSGWATMMQGWAVANLSGFEQGITLLTEGLDIYEGTGARQIKPYALALLAKIHGQAGDPITGLEILKEAYGVDNPTDVVFFEAEAMRVSGELIRLAGQGDGITEFGHANSLAQQQNSPALSLRAMISLCKAVAGTRRQSTTTQNLANIYSLFDPSYSNSDLKEARRLLNDNTTVDQ